MWDINTGLEDDCTRKKISKGYYVAVGFFIFSFLVGTYLGLTSEWVFSVGLWRDNG